MNNDLKLRRGRIIIVILKNNSDKDCIFQIWESWSKQQSRLGVGTFGQMFDLKNSEQQVCIQFCFKMEKILIETDKRRSGKKPTNISGNLTVKGFLPTIRKSQMAVAPIYLRAIRFESTSSAVYS